eukprot:768156-Hanusia_phi.AAC.9
MTALQMSNWDWRSTADKAKDYFALPSSDGILGAATSSTTSQSHEQAPPPAASEQQGGWWKSPSLTMPRWGSVMGYVRPEAVATTGCEHGEAQEERTGEQAQAKLA